VSWWSLAQGNPRECGFSESDREAWIIRRPWPTRNFRSIKKIIRALYLREQGYDDLWYFSEPKEVREQKKCGNTGLEITSEYCHGNERIIQMACRMQEENYYGYE